MKRYSGPIIRLPVALLCLCVQISIVLMKTQDGFRTLGFVLRAGNVIVFCAMILLLCGAYMRKSIAYLRFGIEYLGGFLSMALYLNFLYAFTTDGGGLPRKFILLPAIVCYAISLGADVLDRKNCFDRIKSHIPLSSMALGLHVLLGLFMAVSGCVAVYLFVLNSYLLAALLLTVFVLLLLLSLSIKKWE